LTFRNAFASAFYFGVRAPYLLLFAMCTAGRVELLPVFAYNLGEDAHVGAEEGEALHPDEGKGVVALELQEVGRQQPGALNRKTHYKKAGAVFWIPIRKFLGLHNPDE